MDPAGPYFGDQDPAVRLDPTDAAYVDVIHTDTRVLGTSRNLGHADFFVNGGSEQPGCDSWFYPKGKSLAGRKTGIFAE